MLQKNIKEHNPNQLNILDYPYRILLTGSSGSGKTNSLFNLISQQPDIDKIYANIKNPYKANFQFLISNILTILKLLLNIQMIWMIFDDMV